MQIFIDQTKQGWMITCVPGTVDENGDQDRNHAWPSSKKELIQWFLENIPEIKK
jgi:hypothetical protein